jgi:acyl-ACP thioesterase
MKTNHKFTYCVVPQDVDFTQHLTITSLGNHILNTAGTAALLNNFGMNKLLEENLAWVMSRFAVEMQHYPVQYEEFSIETWVETYGQLFTTRNFRIFDKNQQPIGAACSIWAIIDLKTRRPISLDTKKEWKWFATGIEAGIKSPLRIDEVTANNKQSTCHSVVYSDIDFNHHVNSMKYVQWFADTIDLERFRNKSIARMDVNYIHEALFGEKVQILTSEEEQKTICEIKNISNNVLCKIQFLWNKCL